MPHQLSPESLEALAFRDKAKLREIVPAYIRQRRTYGTSDDEISQALGLGRNPVAACRTELEDAGLVVKVFDRNGNRVRRQTRQGGPAGAYVSAEFAPSFPDSLSVMRHEDRE